MRTVVIGPIGFFLCCVLAGCGPQPDCAEEIRNFGEEIAPLLASACSGCHRIGGLAAIAQPPARMVLRTGVDPWSLGSNRTMTRALALEETGRGPLLVAKAAGMLPHGGGSVLSSSDAQPLRGWVRLVDAHGPDACPTELPELPTLEVEMPDASEHLRQATLHLAGRPPTPDETATVTADPSAMRGVLLGLMTERGFGLRLNEMWLEKLPLRVWEAREPIRRLYAGQFPRRNESFGVWYARDLFALNGRMVMQPYELISYVVRSGRPFSEVLTADYMMVDADLGWLFQAEPVADRPAFDGEDWWPARAMMGAAADDPFPSAGVLTSFAFLNRYPAGGSNQHRTRASVAMNAFLDFDVLDLAERPADPDGTEVDNPVVNDPSCTVCHAIIDPVAGTFRGFEAGWHHLRPLDNPTPLPDNYLPGFDGQLLPLEELRDGVRWLGERVSADPRYPSAVTRTVYGSLAGRAPLREPTADAGVDELALWRREQDFLDGLADRFVASGEDMREVILDVVLSEWFAARSASWVEEGFPEVTALGGGRWSTPERLYQRVAAILGYRWDPLSPGVTVEEGSQDMEILFGGVDSLSVTRRSQEASPLSANGSIRMALAMACRAVSQDFYLLPEDRRMFPSIEMDQVVSDGDAFEERARADIVGLYTTLLGETVAPDDPQVDASWELFVAVQTEGAEWLAQGEAPETMENSRCHATWDPYNEQPLSSGSRIRKDPDYTLRAWTAVVGTLLADWRFLHD